MWFQVIVVLTLILGWFYIKSKSKRVAVVSEIIIYPVKSCGGIRLSQVDFSKEGMTMDRQWTMYYKNNPSLMVTQRLNHKLRQIRTELTDTTLILRCDDKEFVLPRTTPTGAEIEMQIWDLWGTGIDCGQEVADWLSDLIGEKVGLAHIVDNPEVLSTDSNAFGDVAHALIVSQESFDDIYSRVDRPWLVMEAFRPNIVVSGCKAYGEDEWKNMYIGEVQFRGTHPCKRCVIPTIHPETLEIDSDYQPTKTIKNLRLKMFGHNLLASNSGTVHVGDPVICTRFKTFPNK